MAGRRGTVRSRQEEQDRKTRIGWFLIAGSMLAVAAALAGAQWLQKPPYDQDTLCLLNRPSPLRIVILVDRSNNLIGIERVKKLIEAQEQSLPEFGRLSIFEIGADGRTITDAEFDLCNPGRGDQANPLYENPNKIKRFYDRQFREPLDEVLERITQPMSAQRSPIVESVAELLRISRDPPGAEKARLLVISDFLQNTPTYGNAYSSRFSVSRSIETLTLAKGEKPVELIGHVLRRDRHLSRQDIARRKFWDPVLSQAGIPTSWQ